MALSTLHGMHDLAVHLFAAAPKCSYPQVQGFRLDRYTTEPVIREGKAIAPDRRGHGVQFDWQALAKL